MTAPIFFTLSQNFVYEYIDNSNFIRSGYYRQEIEEK